MAGFWKSVLGGPDPETRTIDQAFALLRAGNIDEGRKILRGICRQEPRNLTAAVLFALELSREPQLFDERIEVILQANRLDPQRKEPETRTLFAYLDFSRNDGDGIIKAYNNLPQDPPANPHCAFFYLVVRVELSDIILQSKLKGPLTKMIVQPAVLGGAELSIRHAGAADSFQRGLDAPGETVARYESYLNRPLTPMERADVVDALTFECTLGQALAAYDRSDPMARAHFVNVMGIGIDKKLAGPTIEALNTLAEHFN